MPALRAPFAAGVEFIDLNEGSSVPSCLVLQLAHDLAPPGIVYGFGEGTVFGHVFVLNDSAPITWFSRIIWSRVTRLAYG